MAEKSGGFSDFSELEARLNRIRESAGFASAAGEKENSVNSSMDKADVFGASKAVGVNPDGKSGIDQGLKQGAVVDDEIRVSTMHGVHGSSSQPPLSYAAAVSSFKSVEKVSLRVLHNTEVVEGSDVVLPMPSIRATSSKFENTLYGYFIGKRLAYPVVEQFVKNAWAKYGFKRSMMNGKGFFFFQFDSKVGIDRVLEDGPWLIRNVPIIIDVWTPSVSLTKEGVKAVPLWVKLHDVPIVAFSEEGLSLLTTKIGKPKRLDGHTSDMCRDLWGRSSFARALVEISSDKELKDEIIVAIPSLDGEGYVKERVTIEYEWRPPRCSVCCVFGHEDAKCPKQVVTNAAPNLVASEGVSSGMAGFEVVNKYKEAHRKKFPVKQNSKLIYRPVQSKTANSGQNGKNTQKGQNGKFSNTGQKWHSGQHKAGGLDQNMGQKVNAGQKLNSGKKPDVSGSSSFNRFGPLQVEEDDDDFDEQGLEHIDMREAAKISSEGASTPGLNGFNG